jgi:Tfp pilus assembly protein PilO
MTLRFDVRQSGRRAAVLLAVGIALNAGAYFALVRPHVREAKGLEEDSEPRLEQIKQREAEVAAKERFVQAVDTASKDLASLRQDVLSTKRQRMIAVQLEVAQLASKFGINLERVHYEAPDPEQAGKEGLERFGMKVPLKGGYANLRKFLQAVEASDEFLVIEQVALEGEPDNRAALELNITLATYFDAPELHTEPAPRRGGRSAPAEPAPAEPAPAEREEGA